MTDRKQTLLKAIKRAGKEVLEAIPDAGIEEKEGRGNFATAADLASEKAILDTIQAAFPEDSILSEETDSDVIDPLLEEHIWIIDPIDGTHNFRFNRNYSAISIGYAERGVLKLGAIYDPFHDELFVAELGKGATKNGQPIHVSDVKDLGKGTVTTDNSYDPKMTKHNLELALKFPVTPFMLMRGSAALVMCDIACGRVDLYYHTMLKPWDNAAGFLIATEAGGKITDFNGNPISFLSPEVIIGNPTLVDACVAVFSKK